MLCWREWFRLLYWTHLFAGIVLMWWFSDRCGWCRWLNCSMEFLYGLWEADKHWLNQTLIWTSEHNGDTWSGQTSVDQEAQYDKMCYNSHDEIKIKLRAEWNINWRNDVCPHMYFCDRVTVFSFVFSASHFTLKFFFHSCGQHLSRSH